MTTPEPPAWYQIQRAETGINIRPSGTQEDTGQPPFGDLFTDQIPAVLATIRDYFSDWPEHIKAGIDTGVDWLQTVANLELEWLRSLLHKIVDTTAAVFDVSSWVAFLDTAITAAANLVADSFATVFDWVASLLHGAVRFAENACSLNLTWLHSVIDDLLGWSTAHVALSSQADFIEGINGGGFWNNIVDWMLGGSGSWLDDAIQAITNPINAFFDDVRRFINQMIRGLHLGYLDADWKPVLAWDTPAAHLPGGAGPQLEPGRNDNDGPDISSQVNPALPGAPVSLFGLPWFDPTTPNFPAGNITYAIAAVKNGIEGPAKLMKVFVGTLFPPSSSGHVDLSYGPPPGGADSYRIYRQVDSTYGSSAAVAWRLIYTPTTAYSVLAPLQDKTIRTSGVTAHPKTDAELSAQIVTSVSDTANTAKSTANTAQSTASSAASTASSAQSTANTANTAAGNAQTTANNASSWLSRLLTDLTILFDMFHVTYPVGSESDTKTTTSGGKRTWYSAWADLMDLVGVSQNVSAPTDPATAIGDRLVQSEVNQQNAQNFQISALTGGYRNPMWACRYPIGDVSYPECLNISLTVYDRLGSPSPKSGNAAYTSTSVDPWVARSAVYTLPQNCSRGAYIMVSNTAVMDTIGVIAYATGGTTNNVLLELFRVERGVAATRIFYTDVSAQLDALTQYFEVPLPGGGILAQAGEAYIIRLRNNSTVATSVVMQGIGGVGGSTNVGMFTGNATDTNKTTYTASEAAGHSVAVTPFALFASKGEVATDQLHSDDFNRSGMGALWYLQSTTSDQMGIAFGQASYAGLADGSQHALYTRPTASDRMWVEGNLYNIISGTQEGLLLNCNRDLSQIVYLAVNNTTAKIYTGSSTSLTQRATVNTTNNNVPWQFYFNPTTKVYTVLKNGKSIGLTWTDSGNLMQHGVLYRYGGLRISRGSLVNGGSIDNWLLKDWS